MYVPSAFQIHRAVALKFAAMRGFGLVIACEGGHPVASLLPFLVVERDGQVPRVHFHVARGNPLAALAKKGGPWLIAVAGHDAYVSPDWYATSDQVPTWLYEAVELAGPVRIVPACHTAEHLDRLAAQFEAWHAPKQPWTAERVPRQRRDALMQAIVAIEMTVETVEARFKLNQTKSDADHVAVVRALRTRPDQAGREIADRMVALRPHLAYQ